MGSALEWAGDDQFATLAGLADEWQQVVDQGLGGCDLSVVTKSLGKEDDRNTGAVT